LLDSTLTPANAAGALRDGSTGPLLAVLMARRGATGLGHLVVRQTTIRLGRDAANDVQLESPSVSMAHAELRLRGGVWSLTDLGSMNGSWVDGEPVYGALPVAPGSILRLGEVELAFSPKDRWEDSPSERAAEPLVIEPASAPPRPEPSAEARPAPQPRFMDDVPTFALPEPTRRPGPLLFVAVALAAAALFYFLRQVS
jgi:predicted component of type VI protein secretion system